MRCKYCGGGGCAGCGFEGAEKENTIEAEVIKWVKRERHIADRLTDENAAGILRHSIERWITRFNITEEDLK